MTAHAIYAILKPPAQNDDNDYTEIKISEQNYEWEDRVTVVFSFTQDL